MASAWHLGACAQVEHVRDAGQPLLLVVGDVDEGGVASTPERLQQAQHALPVG